MTLDKIGILAKIEADKASRKIIKVRITDWNEDVCIRMLIAGDRARVEAYLIKKKDITYLRANYICLSLCDDKGELMFDCSKSSFDILYSSGARPIEQLFDYIADLNGLNAKDEEEAIENFTMPTE